MSINEWRERIENEMAGWNKLRYVFLPIVIVVLVLLVFFRLPGYFENQTIAIILSVTGLSLIVKNWNGREEKRILLKIIEKIEEIERE